MQLKFLHWRRDRDRPPQNIGWFGTKVVVHEKVSLSLWFAVKKTKFVVLYCLGEWLQTNIPFCRKKHFFVVSILRIYTFLVVTLSQPFLFLTVAKVPATCFWSCALLIYIAQKNVSSVLCHVKTVVEANSESPKFLVLRFHVLLFKVLFLGECRSVQCRRNEMLETFCTASLLALFTASVALLNRHCNCCGFSVRCNISPFYSAHLQLTLVFQISILQFMAGIEKEGNGWEETGSAVTVSIIKDIIIIWFFLSFILRMSP